MPELFADCPTTLHGFAQRLNTDAVLVTLRSEAAEHLERVPAPIGFLPRKTPSRPQISTTQQSMRERR